MNKSRFLAAMMLPLVFACTKENINKNDDSSFEGSNILVVNLSPADDAVTKTSISDKKGLFWTTGGFAGIKKIEDNWNVVKSKALDKVYDTSVEGGKGDRQASFLFDLGDDFNYAGENLKFFYPYTADVEYIAPETGSAYLKIPYFVNSYQSCSSGVSSDIFYAASKGTLSLDKVNHDTGASAEYSVVGSYICFRIYGGAEGEIVKSVNIHGEGIQGTFYIKGLSYPEDPEDNTFISNSPVGNYVIVGLSDSYDASSSSKDAAKGIYASVLPGEHQCTYTVVTNKAIYKFESESQKAFTCGTIKGIALNLQSTKAQLGDLYFTGDANNWNNNDAASKFTYSAETRKYYLNGVKMTSGQAYKILVNAGNWKGFYYASGTEGKMEFYADESADKTQFKVTSSGVYNIEVDVAQMTITANNVDPYPVCKVKSSSEWVEMQPTGNTSEYKTTFWIWKDTNNHDIQIKKGDRWCHCASDYPQINYTDMQEAYSGYTYDVVLNTSEGGWWINDNWCEKFKYDIIYNVATNKVTIKYAQGKNFWIIGDFHKKTDGKWDTKKYDDYTKSSVNESGIVVWNVECTGETYFRICGENTLEDVSGKNFWGGEWYFSKPGDSNDFRWDWNGGHNYYSESNQKKFDVLVDGSKNWILSYQKKYKISFDTINLKIWVEEVN